MKHQSRFNTDWEVTTRDRQKAGIQQGPVKSVHAIIRLQEDAERQALIDGDQTEAKRARDAVINLEARKRRSGRSTSEPMPEGLIEALGGPYDPICRLVKSKVLTATQARVVLALRDHVEGGTIDIGGSGNMEFVQGGGAAGMEAHCDRRRKGQQAWDLAKKACSTPNTWGALDLLIRGKISLTQACRRVSSDNKKTRQYLHRHLVASLDAAGAFLGIG
jgi:hypothetical protein